MKICQLLTWLMLYGSHVKKMTTKFSCLLKRQKSFILLLRKKLTTDLYLLKIELTSDIFTNLLELTTKVCKHVTGQVNEWLRLKVFEPFLFERIFPDDSQI